MLKALMLLCHRDKKYTTEVISWTGCAVSLSPPFASTFVQIVIFIWKRLIVRNKIYTNSACGICLLISGSYGIEWQLHIHYILKFRMDDHEPNIIKIEFNNCPTRCELFRLLHFCRQLYVFRVLTHIIRSSYNCNYSFWYWLVFIAAYFIHCS